MSVATAKKASDSSVAEKISDKSFLSIPSLYFSGLFFLRLARKLFS